MDGRNRGNQVGPDVPSDWELVRTGGPTPFSSWVSYRLPDRSHYLWESRRQRKRYGPRTAATARSDQRAARAGEPESSKNPWLQFWAPRRLAWWIAVVFMIGSVLFVAGAAGSLVPAFFGGQHAMSMFAEICYFTGALLYTVSIYCQLFECINVDVRLGRDRASHVPRRFRWFDFQPRRLEFLFPFVLLIGSLVFNFETLFALGSTSGVLPELWLWWSSMLGSALFLVASCLQYAEAGHHYISFEPRDVSWWVAVLFIIGSIGFIVGTFPGLEPPGLPTAEHQRGALVVKVGFLIGGVAFFIGSYLMIPEMFTHIRDQHRSRQPVPHAS